MNTIHQQGYALHPCLFTPAEVARLTATLSDLPARSRAGARHLMAQPAAASLQVEAGLHLDVA
jgi:hypothetical protein